MEQSRLWTWLLPAGVAVAAQVCWAAGTLALSSALAVTCLIIASVTLLLLQAPPQAKEPPGPVCASKFIDAEHPELEVPPSSQAPAAKWRWPSVSSVGPTPKAGFGLSSCMPFLSCSSLEAVVRRKGKEPAFGGQEAAAVHPKYCGLRLKAPSRDLPPCHAFQPYPLGGPLLEAWATPALLRCTSEELAGCQALREAVSDAQGPKDAVTLLRFLRARQGRVEVAAAMYRKAMERRFSLGYEVAFRNRSLDEDLHRRLDSYWKPLGLIGLDRDGDPVLWERLGIAHVSAFARFPKDFVIRHETYGLTRIQQAMEELSVTLGRPVMYFTAVEDLSGMGLHMLNRRALKNYKEIVRLCEDDYPEMVKRALVIRAPSVFARIWAVVQGWFDEGTREKIQVVAARDTYSRLVKYIEPEWIPECYGGQLRIGSSSWCEPLIPRPVRGLPADLIEDVVSFTHEPGMAPAG